MKEPSPIAPTSERAFAEQLTIGPKLPSQENLVSLGHKEDLSLPDNPFSTWPLVQLIFATIHLIQTWSPAPTRTLFITYDVWQTHTFSKSKLCTATFTYITTNIHRREVAYDPQPQWIHDTAWVKCAREMWVDADQQQQESSTKIVAFRTWMIDTDPFCVSVLLIWRPIPLSV